MTSTSPSAHVLRDDSGATIGGCAVLVAAGVVFGLVLAIGAGSIFWTILLCLLLGLAVLAAVVAALEMRRWEPFEVHFPVWPLPLGSVSEVRVVRRARQAVPDAELIFDVEVSCKESATYTVGTDTRTDTAVVHRKETRFPGVLENRLFTSTIQLEIPATSGAPSMDLGNNEIEWKLVIDADDLSRLMSEVTFDLEVAPTLDAGLRNIQDTVEDGR